MGFINATYELGKLSLNGVCEPDFDGIDSFLQLPLPIIDDDAKSGRVIRVWLNAKDKNTETLEITGIEKIDTTDFIRNKNGERLLEEKRKYLYRDPTGAATPWKYSPIYKLGKGSNNAMKELIGEEDWRENTKTRFYKLKRTVLDEFDTCGVFSEGSTDLIMEQLEAETDKLAELWSDKNRSYILLFGMRKDNTFYYPGMIPAFKNYFRLKLDQNIGSDISVVCSLCHCRSERSINLDKVFKFATFDKSSFLPGITAGKGVAEKVFPVCQECLSYLSLGRECLDRMFLDIRTLPGIKIYVVPELLFEQKLLGKATSQTRQFIQEGLSTSEHFFHILAKQDTSLTYHFLFWEKNQAQERLHLLVADVPPSRLYLRQQLWKQSYRSLLWNKLKDPNCDLKTITLDNALRTVYSTLISLSGKNENDQKMVQSMIIGIIGNLLNHERVDIKRLKQLMVSRFPSLFADEEWLRFGRYNLRKMMAVIEFLEKANRR